VINVRGFSQLPDAERIALLDDRWALAETGRAELPSDLSLAAAVGTDLDPRAWQRIAGRGLGY
jgi:aminopeptidase N